MYDAQGYRLTTSSAEAARLYNMAQVSLFEYRLSTMQTVKGAFAEDPAFAMAGCLRGYLLMMYGSSSVLKAAKSALQAADAAAESATPRERMHVEALRAWTQGKESQAIARWEQIICDYPLDILALRLHHFSCFWSGRLFSLRGGPASVLDMWSDDIPGYGSVLGMLAFGYEECGQYREAERYGRIAVERAPEDLWALHAVAHVLEMEDRQEEGVQWLSRPEDVWSDRNPFKGHLWWHLALFHIESKQYDEALALYDRSVRNDGSTFYLDIQNAASLLARLEFRGVNVGNRWGSLAEFAEKSIEDHALAFTDLHYMIALSKEKRFDAANRLLASMEEYASNEATDNAGVTRTTSLPLCRGVLAFEQGDFKRALDCIAPLHNNNATIGASHAQRDIIDQYLIEAAIKGDNLMMARMILAERARLRPQNMAVQERYSVVAERVRALEHN